MSHDPVNRALTPPREAEARKVTRRHIWEAAATELRAMDDRLQWSWGKWANEGYTNYDLSYDEMAAIARKRRQTLYNRAAVHRAWPEAERVYPELTWSHYEAVYSFESPWLRHNLMGWARDNNKTVDELRQKAREERAALEGITLDDRPQSFTGTGTARIEGEYRLIVDIDPQTLNMPDWAFDGADVEITIRRRKP